MENSERITKYIYLVGGISSIAFFAYVNDFRISAEFLVMAIVLSVVLFWAYRLNIRQIKSAGIFTKAFRTLNKTDQNVYAQSTCLMMGLGSLSLALLIFAAVFGLTGQARDTVFVSAIVLGGVAFLFGQRREYLERRVVKREQEETDEQQKTIHL